MLPDNDLKYIRSEVKFFKALGPIKSLQPETFLMAIGL